LSEKDLAKLCASLNPVMAQPAYVYCSFIDFGLPIGLVPFCTVREDEGLTAVIGRLDAERLRLPYTFESRLITVISRTLAQAGIPCNAIAGYCHDHIFVPVDRAEEAMTLLNKIAAASRS